MKKHLILIPLCFAFIEEKVIPRVLVTYNFFFLRFIDSTTDYFVKRELKGIIISAYHCSKGSCKDDGDKCFSVMGRRPQFGGSDWVSGNDSSLAEWSAGNGHQETKSLLPGQMSRLRSIWDSLQAKLTWFILDCRISSSPFQGTFSPSMTWALWCLQRFLPKLQPAH